MGWAHLGDPADPPGQQQGRHPKAARSSPGRLHLGPWQTSPGAMEATGDGRAVTQSRRGSPAKQRGPTIRATGVRRSYRRLAGAISPVVRDTPHGWGTLRAAAQRRGHVALPMDTCGDTLPSGTPGLGGRDTAFPSTCGSGLRGTSTSAVGGTGSPPGKTFLLHCQRRHPELRKIPTYLKKKNKKKEGAWIGASGAERSTALAPRLDRPGVNPVQRTGASKAAGRI